VSALDLAIIDQLAHGRFGMFDAPCPQCGPERRKPANQRKPVLRIWHLDRHFATYHCARCGMSGHARDGSARLNLAAITRAKAESAERERVAKAERLSKARWLWACGQSAKGTIAESYLRDARGYDGPLPATLRFLPARGEHGPAMLAAFGIATEPDPGRIAISDDAVRGVHITRLAPDGSGKAGTDVDRIIVGTSKGWPIVLAAPNDLLGLAVTEGIEDGLTAHLATGLGVWAAGSAAHMPALAGVVPDYIECTTIYAHDDEDGQRGARELASGLSRRGIVVYVEGLL
jgi:hypothetical protein